MALKAEQDLPELVIKYLARQEAERQERLLRDRVAGYFDRNPKAKKKRPDSGDEYYHASTPFPTDGKVIMATISTETADLETTPILVGIRRSEEKLVLLPDPGESYIWQKRWSEDYRTWMPARRKINLADVREYEDLLTKMGVT